MSPLCESYVSADQLNAMEPFYPLHTFVCDRCWLVQLLEYVSAASIYGEYAYFSSYSDSWLKHAQDYVEMIVQRLGLNSSHRVMEVASNDGYLLKNFVARGFNVLGVEPAANVARAAIENGVPTHVEFLGELVARKLVEKAGPADLLLGNNVLAHVPDLNDFVRGLRVLLAPTGTLTMEFPHLQRLMEGNQFDTIYHEHFCYFSFLSVEQAFTRHGLRVFDVEELPTHGGSLRVYVGHAEDPTKPFSTRVADLRTRELKLGFNRLEAYRTFNEQVCETKRKLLEFLVAEKRAGKAIAGYGAPGKGNTLLNFCGIRTDFIDYTVDRNSYKQGKFLPGTHIPIHAPEKLRETKPDYVLILPWNLRDEIVCQLDYVRGWGGRLVIPIPRLEVI